MNSNRKLASVQLVQKISPIEGADRIESVGVLGWECVVQKDTFHVGDSCVYFELDSFLPVRPEFEMLRANSYKRTDLMGEGFRLKTQKFKGRLSQGLVMPMSILPEGCYSIGEDVSDALCVKEWAREEERDVFGTIIADMPAFLKRTGEFRIQSYPDLMTELTGKPYYISNKIDGVSTTIFKNEEVTGICGHECLYDFTTYKYLNLVRPFFDNLLTQPLYKNIAIQGEMAGPGICGNRAGLKEVGFYAFNVMDIDTHTYLDFKDFTRVCKVLDIPTVEIVECGDNFRYSMDQLLHMADGVYQQTGKRREGIVIRSQKTQDSQVLGNERLSFKVLNNKYLLKNDG